MESETECLQFPVTAGIFRRVLGENFIIPLSVFKTNKKFEYKQYRLLHFAFPFLPQNTKRTPWNYKNKLAWITSIQVRRHQISSPGPSVKKKLFPPNKLEYD